MATGVRPGGLTTLATLNFALGAIYALPMLAAWWSVSFGAGTLTALNKADLFRTLFYPLVVGLLILSGVGLLRMSSVLGRHAANLYALADLAGTALLVWVYEKPFETNLLLGLVYPMLLLSLLNTAFREDFE